MEMLAGELRGRLTDSGRGRGREGQMNKPANGGGETRLIFSPPGTQWHSVALPPPRHFTFVVPETPVNARPQAMDQRASKFDDDGSASVCLSREDRGIKGRKPMHDICPRVGSEF